jgi:imidazolonepropionase-like amidohydrolase
VDLGRAVRIPATARRVEVKGGVITPGFIDTLSHVGTHTDRLAGPVSPPRRTTRPARPRRGPPRRATSRTSRRAERSAAVSVKENLADVVRPGDEGYAELLRAGVTTVILGPDGNSPAQLAAIRIGADSADDFVLARVAGLRHPLKLSPGASREAAAKGLDGVLKRAEAHIAKLAKYEKDLAAYRELKREAAAGDPEKKKAFAKAKKPSKPKTDPVNEAWRAVLEKRAAVVVPIEREDTIRAALEVFARHGVKPVLQEAREAHLVADQVRERAAGVLVRPPFVTRDARGGRVFNAGRLGDAKVDLAFYSAGRSGGKYLPLHAAAAVREGLDPEVALHGLTVTAARLFRIHDHVGSLAPGKHGDLVVFSGDPLDLSSRILLVVAGGRIVYDAREGQGKGAP